MRDLTTSAIDRQNILNNLDAVKNIQEYLGVKGLLFEGEFKFTTKMVAEFYKIDIKTVRRYVENSHNEIVHNGYEVIKGQKLKLFKEQFGHFLTKLDDIEQKDIDVPLLTETIDNQSKSRLKALALFNFRAFLNLGMLLVESEMAKAIRSKMLDIVIDTLNKRLGGSTKYINQRDEDFFHSILKEPMYRKEFTTALHNHLNMGNYKYAYYTDAIYKCIFQENAKEYKQILKLEEQENPRDTMYAEVLNLIASFETGLAYEMEIKAGVLGRMLEKNEMDELIKIFADHPSHKPHIENARIKMATRDYGFRQVLHENLKHYIGSIDLSDYQRFLGDKSKVLQDRIEDSIDVFKRLKDR